MPVSAVCVLVPGGVLIFAVNSLMYLNQSVPPYGVSLNSLTDFSTEFLVSKYTATEFYPQVCIDFQ